MYADSVVVSPGDVAGDGGGARQALPAQRPHRADASQWIDRRQVRPYASRRTWRTQTVVPLGKCFGASGSRWTSPCAIWRKARPRAFVPERHRERPPCALGGRAPALLAADLDLKFDELMARAGRFGNDAEQAYTAASGRRRPLSSHLGQAFAGRGPQEALDDRREDGDGRRAGHEAVLGPRGGEERIWFEPSEIEQMMASELCRLAADGRCACGQPGRVHRTASQGDALDQYADLEAGVLGVTEFLEGKPPKGSRSTRISLARRSTRTESPPGRLGAAGALTLAHEAGHVLLHRSLFRVRRRKHGACSRRATPGDEGRQLHRCLKRDADLLGRRRLARGAGESRATVCAVDAQGVLREDRARRPKRSFRTATLFPPGGGPRSRSACTPPRRLSPGSVHPPDDGGASRSRGGRGA